MAAVVGGRAGSFRSSSSAGLSSGYGAPAAALSTNSSGGDTRAGVDEDDGQNLWSCILSEVSTRSRSKLPSGKNVVLLGEDGAGKTSLIGKLQGIEDYKKGRGMEYLYLNVHDEDRDDSSVTLSSRVTVCIHSWRSASVEPRSDVPFPLPPPPLQTHQLKHLPTAPFKTVRK